MPGRRDRRPSPLGRAGRFARRLLVGVLVGGGTIFGAKAERDQHWSTPPTMQVDQHAGDERAGGDPPPGRLPACA